MDIIDKARLGFGLMVLMLLAAPWVLPEEAQAPAARAVVLLGRSMAS